MNLQDKTKYIVVSSSEIISPGFTPIYVNFLQHICKNESNLISFAKDYFNHYDLMDGFLRLATISVIDTSQLDELALLMSAIGEHREFSLDNI